MINGHHKPFWQIHNDPFVCAANSYMCGSLSSLFLMCFHVRNSGAAIAIHSFLLAHSEQKRCCSSSMRNWWFCEYDSTGDICLVLNWMTTHRLSKSQLCIRKIGMRRKNIYVNTCSIALFSKLTLFTEIIGLTSKRIFCWILNGKYLRFPEIDKYTNCTPLAAYPFCFKLNNIDHQFVCRVSFNAVFVEITDALSTFLLKEKKTNKKKDTSGKFLSKKGQANRVTDERGKQNVQRIIVWKVIMRYWIYTYSGRAAPWYTGVYVYIRGYILSDSKWNIDAEEEKEQLYSYRCFFFFFVFHFFRFMWCTAFPVEINSSCNGDVMITSKTFNYY